MSNENDFKMEVYMNVLGELDKTRKQRDILLQHIKPFVEVVNKYDKQDDYTLELFMKELDYEDFDKLREAAQSCK